MNTSDILYSDSYKRNQDTEQHQHHGLLQLYEAVWHRNIEHFDLPQNLPEGPNIKKSAHEQLGTSIKLQSEICQQDKK